MHPGLPDDDGFTKLDGTIVRAVGRAWCLTIFSSHIERGRRWLQANVAAGTEELPVLISLATSVRPDAVSEAVAKWLESGGTEARVVEID